MNQFLGIFFIILGLVGFFLKKSHARSAKKWNLKTVGFSGSERGYEIVFMICGIIFFIFGIIVCLGLIHFKS
jgi:hypothetical protein